MALHELKTTPAYFKSVKAGRKNFECRKDDRGYKVGDELLLREWKPKATIPITDATGKPFPEIKGEYTGAICHRRVTYVLREFEGLQPGFAILGIEPV